MMNLDSLHGIPRRKAKAAKQKTYSHWLTEHRGPDGQLKNPETAAWFHNLKTDDATGYTNRRDWQAKAMGGGPAPVATMAGTATATSATSLTNSGASFPTGGGEGAGLQGQIVAASSDAGSNVYGVIVSNTGTVLTIDRWYSAGTGGLGTTPAGTCKYQVLPGQAPCQWLAVSAEGTAPDDNDTILIGEATADGFARKVATWSHTAKATTYLLSAVYTATGSLTPSKYGNFGASTVDTGAFPFTSSIGSPPVMLSGDTLTLNVTVTIN